FAVRVQLDPHALASRGIGIDEVADAVRNANVNLPTGTPYGKERAFTVQATGQLTDAKAYGPVIVTYRNGAPVRLEQLGRVIDSVEDDKTASWYLDQQTTERAIVLAIQRQPGTNTVQVAEDVKALLPVLGKEIPPSVTLRVLFDRSQSIRDSVNDVKVTMLIAFTILSMTLSLAAVFIPVLFMPGILGRLFHEFAVTICVAILLSGFVSLTLTPMLCARFLRPHARERHGRFYQATERIFDRLLDAYRRSLAWVLRHRPATMLVSLEILVATVVLFRAVAKGFIPDQDQSAIFAVAEAEQGISFEAMVERQQAVAAIISQDAN